MRIYREIVMIYNVRRSADTLTLQLISHETQLQHSDSGP